MKRYILFFFFLFPFLLSAQDGINYQGAATDANGDELTNQNISIRASVLSASASGNLEWEETHSATTDQFGLFKIVIGQGSSTTNGATATFDDMDWGAANHFLKIEVDATGGTNYAMIGTTQMMSVPYALYAKSAGIDSTMLANMIASSGGGSGCDWRFPDGLDGEMVIIDIHSPNTGYTVPLGKNLYILRAIGSYPVTADLVINNMLCLDYTNNSNLDNTPIIVKSGDVISGSWPNPSNSYIYGFLINQNVEPVYIDINSLSYTVPASKKLYVLRVNNTGGTTKLSINNIEVAWISHNTGLSINPIIVESGDVISSNNFNGGFSYIFGYLADENYFAACGGGSSSSNTLQGGTSLGQMLYWNGSEWDTISPGTYGQHLTVCEGIPIWTTDGVCPIPLNLAIGDIWGGGVVAYILQPGDNGYITGEVHGFVAAVNDIGTQAWNCGSVSSLSSSIGDGYANTEHLFNTCSQVCAAANACYNLVLNGYSEWFLPSKDLLNELYINRVAIGGFSNGDYWSSSTQWVNYASKQNFGDGSQIETHKWHSFQIRPVWKF